MIPTTRFFPFLKFQLPLNTFNVAAPNIAKSTVELRQSSSCLSIVGAFPINLTLDTHSHVLPTKRKEASNRLDDLLLPIAGVLL
jgi:hypothetical protein